MERGAAYLEDARLRYRSMGHSVCCLILSRSVPCHPAFTSGCDVATARARSQALDLNQSAFRHQQGKRHGSMEARIDARINAKLREWEGNDDLDRRIDERIRLRLSK